ncbi:MAG: hypothetical protein ABIQ52_17355 [Vicinamibacterales bacterium]
MKELFAAILAFALQHPTMPAGMSHDEHLKQMAKDGELKKRGTIAMGFDQEKTAHHFRTSATGGSIDVEVKDPADTASRDQIRGHLKEIASAFATGDFTKPFQTHAEVPPGVPAMERLKAVIRYKYEETARGAMVRITTSDPEALEAIHEFLAYQAREHHGGDPLAMRD